MTKITVEFNLPNDDTEFFDYCNAAKYKTALYEIYNIARNQLKYGDVSDDRSELETIRELSFFEDQ